jgi:hypothetical protein
VDGASLITGQKPASAAGVRRVVLKALGVWYLPLLRILSCNGEEIMA